jgi:hypothetical protein
LVNAGNTTGRAHKLSELTMSGEVADDVPHNLEFPQKKEGRLLFSGLLLVCAAAMAGWIVFLAWGAGHLLGIW